MSENFADQYSRPNWSGQDRGTYNVEDPVAFHILTREEPLNGTLENNNRRLSLTEWTLVGNLITGSNETTIKA